MKIRIGYEIQYDCPAPTPMMLMLNVHQSRTADLVQPDLITVSPWMPHWAPMSGYRDLFGNWCTRIIAAPGRTTITADAVIHDSGLPDAVSPFAHQHAVEALPDETLVYLLGSRYCETDRLTDIAWQLFGHTPLGWGRVQAICDFVHAHLTFGYGFARPTKTAWEAYNERAGVCRDFAHLALTLTRCMNIPARYVTGYLGDIGIPPVDAPMDFSGWFEAYLDGRWYTFDARHNTPRIGRVPIGYGRDAADVAISNTFGPNLLAGFRVWTDEV